MFKNKFILIFILLLLILPNVLSWSCETHIYLCEHNHNYFSPNPNGCCRADKEYKPALQFHHCEGNLSLCSARVKALDYYYIYENQTIITYVNQTIGNYTNYNVAIPITNQVQINPNLDLDLYWHLMDDAESNSHWYYLNSADHSDFENCVNDAVININNNHNEWICSRTYTTKSGLVVNLYKDNNFLKYIEPPKQIVQEAVNYTQPVYNNYIPIKKGLWEQFIDWLKSLFSSKVNNNYNQTNSS